MPPVPIEATFLEDLKQYVGFNEASSTELRDLYPLAKPHLPRIVDDFYAVIQAHPRASQAVRGGEAQIARLKDTLIRWLETTLLGPHDEAYFEARARIGRIHVRIDLPQAYMFTAMNRIRVRLVEILLEQMGHRPERLARVSTALHQILDIELAIMLETYREDLMTKNRNAEGLATIGRFSATVGHELRNPLAVIESSVHLLRQHLGTDGAERPAIRRHLDRIASEAKRSTNTISDLLDLARNRPLRRARAPIHALIEGAIQTALLPAGVNVMMSLPGDLSGDVDVDQIHHVLTNLLTNASQSMNGSGRIWIEGEAFDEGVRIRVRDDGPGVPAEVRSRIFEPLFTTKAQGTGLGLALCRRILEAHDGTIDLEPSDRGASFALWIPGVPSAGQAEAS